MAAPGRLSWNLATTREKWGLLEAAEGLAKAGVGAMAPWRDAVDAVGTAAAKRALAANGLRPSSLCRAGMFPAPDAAGRAAALDDNRRAVDMAAEIGAPVLVLIAGGLAQGSRDLAAAHGMVEDGVAALLPHARAAGVKLAIEPLHPMYAADRACVNSLSHALDICDRLADDGLGVAVDVYHVWWDPALEAQIARAGAARLFGFHVCDWLVPTRDLLLDRGMMGDGVIDIRRIRGWMDRAGYDGPIEVEIFSSRNWWRRDPAEVVGIAKTRFADCV